ncbi:Gonadotropin-releasing hormone II receptor [Halotydeus destructor]|nr:Gonadotropin-releasing hormone II receptor [Halotydeus destructor]
MDDNLNVTSVAYAITERPSCISYFVPKTGDVYRIFFVLCYLVMLTIGTIENVGALVYLIRHRYRNHGSKILLINLTVANLIVADIIIPIEILWRVSYVWPTGPVGCKVLQYFRALGHYSTSMMLVAISVDRYIILTNPFCQHSTRNVRMMVLVAWLTAILFSIPQVSDAKVLIHIRFSQVRFLSFQSFVFSLKRHPRCHEFIQCVPYNYFTLPWGLSAYNIISLVAVYFVPLIIMISCYGIILRRIWKEGNEFTSKGYLISFFWYRILPCTE